MKGLTPGDTLELRIEKAVYRGLGLARHEGQVVFIPRAVPGDLVRVRIELARPGYVEATVESLIERSADRRPSPCPYVPRCGGCTYQEIDYAGQLRLKEEILRESLRRAGAPWEGEIALRGSPEEGWRIRASLHVGVGDGALLLGLHRQGSHEIVDLEKCLQLSAAMNGAARGMRSALAERPDLWRRIKGIDLAESPSGGDLVASIVAQMDAGEATALLFLGQGLPALTGLGVETVGRQRQFLLLRGSPYIRARLLGSALRAHVRSFFQGNRFLVESLARGVLDLVPLTGSVLDLYAGVGLFAVPLATRGQPVTAVELNESAADDAVANAQTARLRNVRVIKGDVVEGLRSWPKTTGEHVVLDPPRVGAGPEVVAAIAARRPETVVYVSCDPPTLGRDLAAFAKAGYRPDRLLAFDLFPDTFHLETVVRLVPVG